MDFYSNLLDSMMDCCGHCRLRRAPVYTLSMLALALGACLNVLSIIDLLWSIGALANPYHSGGQLRPQHYVCALLCLAFMLNTILARRKFSADQRLAGRRHASPSRFAAPTYVLASSGFFLLTLLSAHP